MSRVIASIIVASGLSLAALADQPDRLEQTGEALAWTVAAYGSCEDETQLQVDFKQEAAVLQSDFTEVMAALAILSDANNVCGMKTTFAIDMQQLATTDMESFEAKLLTFEDPPAPVFGSDQPEGAGESHASVILEAASTPPPESSGAPSSESDYQ